MEDPDQLVRLLLSLPEREMRLAVAAEALNEQPITDSLALVATALERAERRLPNADIVLDALTAILASPTRLDGERQAELYAAAKDAGRTDVERLILAPGAEREAAVLEPDAKLAALTLGYKKSWARRADRDGIQRLLKDSDPTVLANLFLNPRLREADVVQIAARRPVLAAVLATVYRSGWSQRYNVRRALTKNPFTPIDIALKLVPTLLAPDLRDLCASASLHAMVRSAAQQALNRR